MTTYRVNNIYASIQGEGCQSGVPMVIIRLQGCSVGCPWCDTKETWHRQERFQRPSDRIGIRDAFTIDSGKNPYFVNLAAHEICTYIVNRFVGTSAIRWALITGGEPAEQSLTDLVQRLHGIGFRVALETSGTSEILDAAADEIDWICVSPKIAMPGGKEVLSSVLAVAHEIKHVVGRMSHVADLNELLDACDQPLRKGVQICLQPVSQQETATAICVSMCQKMGWRLSIQTHKLLGVE